MGEKMDHPVLFTNSDYPFGIFKLFLSVFRKYVFSITPN